MRTGVFVEGRGRIRGPEDFGNGPRPLGPRSALAGSSQSRVCPGKGPEAGSGGRYLRQRADICSSVLPLVSGTIFQTKRADRSDMKA